MSVIVTDEQLPDLAAPAPRNQVLVGTVLAGLAAVSLIGGMLGTWVLLREQVVSEGGRFPLKYEIAVAPANAMLITVLLALFFSVYAWTAGGNDDRPHATLALIVVAILGVAFINAQAFAWFRMGVPVAADYYGPLFYGLTGTMVAVAAGGVAYSAVAIFSSLTGRVRGSGALAGHLVYWIFTTVAYAAVWSVVYIAK